MLRYGELFLKGRNRPSFERQLRKNIEALTGKKVHSTRGRLLMDYFSGHQQLRRVFGLTSYSPAFKVEKDIEQIKAAALNMARQFSLFSAPFSAPFKPQTFKVETTRSDKTFPLTSLHLNTLLGKHIEQETTLRAEYKHPQRTLQRTIFLEINQAGAFLYTEIIPGAGGLPVGSSGPVLLLVEDEASILAGLLMMKRGCTVIPLSGEKEPDLSLLQKFSPQALPLKVMNDNQGLGTFIEHTFIEQRDLVLVTGEVLEKNKGWEKKKKQEGLLTLKPLVASSREEIRTRLEIFKGITF